MDIVEILKGKIAALPQGDYALGLLAVETHIRCGIRHLNRGQSEPDATAFTDTIYRCNQAFEGSIKEAYRVLAAKDPSKKSTAQIEEFLTKNQILRHRVLQQFTNYRQEWRNPSTHDYTLDFDASEALLAIVSVTAFATVLCDQIQAFALSQSIVDKIKVKSRSFVEDGNLREQVMNLVYEFSQLYVESGEFAAGYPEIELNAILFGYMQASFDYDEMVSISFDYKTKEHDFTLSVSRENELIAIEVRHLTEPSVPQLIASVSKFRDAPGTGITSGLVFAFMPNVTDVVTAYMSVAAHNDVGLVIPRALYILTQGLFPKNITTPGSAVLNHGHKQYKEPID